MGRYKVDRGMLRTVWAMEKPRNICTTHGQELIWGIAGEKVGTKRIGAKGNIGTTVVE